MAAGNRYASRKNDNANAIIDNGNLPYHFSAITFGTFGAFGNGTWSLKSNRTALLLRSLGPKVSEGTRHHRHALDGLPRRKPCTTAVWDESVSFPRLTTTYVWTSPSLGDVAYA